MTRKEKLLQDLIITLAGLILMFAIAWFGLAPAANADKAPPAPQDYQWSIFWGETGHILCYESAAAKEQGQSPAGILNFDVTGSDVVTITCRQPGTEVEGVGVRFKDGG